MRGFALTVLLCAVGAAFALEDFDPAVLTPAEEERALAAPEPAAPPAEIAAYGTFSVDRAADGHFWVDARINGSQLRALVDTGATTVAFGREDARRAGIHVSDSDFTGISATAGGRVRIAPVTIARIEVGPLVATNVPGAVLDMSGVPPLLGQSFLNELREVAIRDGRLLMR